MPKTRKTSFRAIQLYRNSRPLPRACFVHEHSARRTAIWVAWNSSLPGDTVELVNRETGRVIGLGYRATLAGVVKTTSALAKGRS